MVFERLQAGICCGLILFGLLGEAVEARTFRSAETHPAGYPTTDSVIEMGRLLVEASGGRQSIQVFHSNQLGEEADTIAQTEAGVIDMNRVNLAPYNNRVPETLALSLPFLFSSQDHLYRTLDSPIGHQILDAFAKHGVIGLAFYSSGTRSLYLKQPIHSVAEMKGLRIRVQQSEIFSALIQAFGGQPQQMPFGQVLTALQTGLVDGAENNLPSYDTAGHYQIAPYYILTEHVMTPEILVMSKKVWTQLSAADQVMVRRAAEGSVSFNRRRWAEMEQASMAKMQAAQVTRIGLSAEARQGFADAAAPLRQRFITSPQLKELVRKIEALR